MTRSCRCTSWQSYWGGRASKARTQRSWRRSCSQQPRRKPKPAQKAMPLMATAATASAKAATATTTRSSIADRASRPVGALLAQQVIHKVTIERLPEEVQRLGLDAFERIGEDRMTTSERRVAALFEVTVIRPKFRAKTDAAVEAVQLARTERDVVAEVDRRAGSRRLHRPSRRSPARA